jgi:UDP-3-O-[3-hydroxymyristoyl] glucosamine N-acyltransferase
MKSNSGVILKFTNRNVYISPSAQLGTNVRVGDNTAIYDNVIVEDNCIIANDCVVGEPVSEYYLAPDGYINPPTIIGRNSLIRSHSIIYCSSKLGEGFSSGHRITVRENSVFGSHCRLGTLCDIQGNSTFGDYCWLHSNVHIGQQSILGNFVFIYPYVVLTNDPTPPSNTVLGPSVGDYSQIAVFSVLLPGVKVGRHCLIGAGSVVGRDVEDFQLALGNPARAVRHVSEIRSRETGESHYPWPLHFDRGMPWEDRDFGDWISTQDKYKL